MFTENLAVYRDTVTGFADTATLDGEDVAVIFDAEYIDPLEVESSGPVAELPSVDCPGVAHGSVLVVTSGIGAGTWTVRGVKPNLNSPGFTVLKLEAQ